ncbi:MAG: alpha/beta hydrolase [Oscillatoriales cyanobacterium RM2_1_1]|nr:alpha/beta hydrolase [Oscillatoriales cyanobacterium SM2_3_0]NJO46501.1 alpha/beta hydrolase [Oscillatoriales cyanobacterium RM2_1_1]
MNQAINQNLLNQSTAINSSSAYVEINGIEHYYQWIRAGQNSEVPKPVMVFIHGWGGSGRYWESTAEALSKDFDCLIYDLRGFGRSTRASIHPTPQTTPANSNTTRNTSNDKPDYELTGYAEDLAILLKRLNLDKVYLNAHSMGGSIAALFLNLYPERVEQAILTCSGIFEYDHRTFTTFHTLSRYIVMFRPKWLLNIPWMDRMFMARFLYRPLPSSVSRAFLEDFLLADFAAAYGTVLTSVSQAATEWLPRQFEQFTVPTLLVAGEYDQIIPANMGQAAANLNDCIEFVMLKNTAHFPMLEDAPTYLIAVRKFLGFADSVPA